VLLGLRTAIHANGLAPASLIYGEVISLPIDLLAPPIKKITSEGSTLVKNLRTNSWRLRETIFLNGDKMGHQSKEEVPSGNEWVWIEGKPIKPSLAPRYTGPYQVLKRTGPVITINKDNKEYKINVDMTKSAFYVNENLETDEESEEEDEEGNDVNHRSVGNEDSKVEDEDDREAYTTANEEEGPEEIVQENGDNQAEEIIGKRVVRPPNRYGFTRTN
jgi:hypothetical protein